MRSNIDIPSLGNEGCFGMEVNIWCSISEMMRTTMTLNIALVPNRPSRYRSKNSGIRDICCSMLLPQTLQKK